LEEDTIMNKPTIAALVALYAVPGTALAAHAPSLAQALDRAVQVRAGNIAPPGNWTTGYISRPDGSKTYIRIAGRDDDDDDDWSRCGWIGSNGGG
jgi:hypothetical protein